MCIEGCVLIGVRLGPRLVCGHPTAHTPHTARTRTARDTKGRRQEGDLCTVVPQVNSGLGRNHPCAVCHSVRPAPFSHILGSLGTGRVRHGAAHSCRKWGKPGDESARPLIGCPAGTQVCCLTRPAANFRKSVIAAVAFGNSTGLPITLLSVIHASFAKTHPLGRINPTLFLAVYLIPYPVLQWVAGGYLMGLLTPGAPGGEADPEALARVPSDPRRSLTVCLQSTEHFLPDPEPQPPPPAPGAAPGAAAQYAPMDVGDEGPEGRRCRAALRPLLGNLLQPPVVATLLGLLIALTHGTAVDLRHVLVDTEGRRGDAVLQWWFNAVLKIGQAAVPMNMFILGAGLGSFDWGSVKTAPWATNALVVLCKMVLMPCVGVLEALLIRWAVELDGPADSSFFLVVMVVTVTPTANNIAVMAEVAGQDPGLLSTCVFLQYVCAPFLLTMSVAASVAVSQSL